MSAQVTITAKYGSPGAAYESKFCQLWHVQQDFAWFPAEKIFINSDFKTKLFIAFTALQQAGLHTEIETFDGCLEERNTRGSSIASLHCWAMAMDLNAAKNPMHRQPTDAQRQGSWSDAFIKTMKAAGLFFGGEFISRADPMHFSLYDG
jgi:hypothetical protein